jgi:hypothetical protein
MIDPRVRTRFYPAPLRNFRHVYAGPARDFIKLTEPSQEDRREL